MMHQDTKEALLSLADMVGIALLVVVLVLWVIPASCGAIVRTIHNHVERRCVETTERNGR